ncbi:hypothetical protein [Coleofasciculus chthonoplastes]|uniref:hypothetical protein n=1 Tax=Coleofasciculus chthonoplastes TaxID=64178 RepID=UPI00406485C9
MNPASLDQKLIPALENGDRLSRAEFERRYKRKRVGGDRGLVRMTMLKERQS